MFTGSGKYSFGKAFRNIVGKQAGRSLRDAVMEKIVNGVRGDGLYTGSGAYTKKKKPKKRFSSRSYKRRTSTTKAARGRPKPWGNNLVRGTRSRSNANFKTMINETGDVIITHREYLGDIYGPTTQFNNQSFQLNPGVEQTFPWLSQVASNYEEYEFKQLVFSYRSVTTDVGSSTTGQCGTIVMATNYNPDAKPFYDKGQMLEYAHAMSCKTTESMTHGVECDPKKSALTSRLFVRSGPPPPGTDDLKDYDTGKFQLAICNAPTSYQNLPIGELWCYYKVLLSKPKIFTGRGNAISRWFAIGNNVSYGAKPTLRNGMISTQIYTDSQNNLPCQLTGGNGNWTVTLPANRGGAFCLKTMLRVGGGVATTADTVPPDFGFVGNIVPINDMPAQEGFPSYYYKAPLIPTGSTSGDTVTEIHFFVTQAQAGVNNQVTISLNQANSNTQGIMWIEVAEYNSFGIENQNQYPVMVDPATQTRIPMNNV